MTDSQISYDQKELTKHAYIIIYSVHAKQGFTNMIMIL